MLEREKKSGGRRPKCGTRPPPPPRTSGDGPPSGARRPTCGTAPEGENLGGGRRATPGGGEREGQIIERGKEAQEPEGGGPEG